MYYTLGAAVDIEDVYYALEAAVDIMDISYTLGAAVDIVDISLNLGSSPQPECQGPKGQLLWCTANISETLRAAR